ncbi:MAG: hypothetical protein FJX74_22690 [Armatimonadetes bacterium]|nr:hypothetical protein [Armatimonadota bacterium]
MLSISIFVTDDPPQGEDARTVRAVEAVAARFPGAVVVQLFPLDGERAEDLGLRMGPAVVEGDMVLSVGEPISAGRLRRYIEARLGEEAPSAVGDD